MSLEQPGLIQQHESEVPSASLNVGTWVLSDSAPTPPYNLAASSSSSEIPEDDVDPQIIEALKSKDRIYVLKLGEVMESLIREGRMRADLTPATSYQRLLVHRCSAYYRMTPENDPVTKGIWVRNTVDSRIPPRRICELVPAETTAQPAFQIMRRSTNSKTQSSRAGSDAGDLSDSETGSMASGKKRSNRTIEEREAAYNEARSRIFMNFDQKEKDSASSSTLSLVSTRDSGSIDDDSVGTPATESERSGPAIQPNVQDKRRAGSSNGGSTSRRPVRDKPIANGHDSSRSSRAASPSYATLHDPPPQMHGHDPAMKGPYPATYYYYPPPPPGYIPPPLYGYYPPYPPYQPPHNGEAYTPPAQPHPYPYPYPWPPPPHSTPASPPPATQPLPQPPQNGYQYMPPPYPYPMHPPQAYYTPPMMSSPELAPFEGEQHGLWSPNDQIPPRRQRKGGGAWSYGPGIGQHGDGGTTAPRFNVNPRRTSNRSVNGDDESNASSSTTSSHSSRRTYTSTTSSQHHPLPARPDWAVGLKPQPAHRHHNGHSSPARKQQQPPLPTDFPPLTSSSASVQKPTATPAGAWTNTRAILRPPQAEKDVAEGMQDLSLGQS